MAEFAPDVVERVAGYMHGTPAASVLLIAKVVGGDPDATAARIVGFDTEALLILATVVEGEGEGEVEVRIPWPAPALTRGDVKDRLFLLLDQALSAWDGK